jgi:hypothetical protein
MSDQDSTVDLGGYGAISPISGYGSDTVTLSPSTYSVDLSGMTTSTITLPSSSTYYGAGATVGGITSINSINSPWHTGTVPVTGTTGYTYNTSVTPNTVNITSNGIDMAAGTDIKVDGKSLKEFMKKMEQRLAILVPDPAKLEKFEALKKAYEHYKTMESLCFDEPEEEK